MADAGSEKASRGELVAALASRLVALGAGRPRLVAALALAAFVAGLAYMAANLQVRTDLDGLISPDLPWRRTTATLERTFPQMGDDIAVVIDAATPEQAAQATSGLTAALQARPDLFRHVDQTAGFMDREGLLFLPLAEVKAQTEALIGAQPLLGPVAADPSLRGLASALQTSLGDAERDSERLGKLAPPLARVASALDQAAQGRKAAVSWRAILSGDPADPSDLRRIVRVTPVVDFSQVAPGARATEAIRASARSLGLTPQAGVRVRLTGSIPMADEELASLGEAIGPIALLSLAGMVLVLFLATRSLRLVAAIAATVLAGLAITGALGLAIYGAFNVISVAFMPLFVGLGMDFAVQFAVRYRAVAAGEPTVALALTGAARSIGRSLALAAAAAAIGFLSFLPTAYKGVSQLGGIAGLGMAIAFLLTVTLLPALIRLLEARPPAPRQRQARPPWPGALPVLGLASLLAVGALGLLRFDFDPISLRSPRTESIATYRELARNPDTTPDTLDLQRHDLASATALAGRLDRLPQVAHAYTAGDLIPPDQPQKLALLGDAAMLLDTTLSPFETAPAPSDAEVVASLKAAAQRLREVAAAPGQPPGPADSVRRSAAILERIAEGPPAARARAQQQVMGHLPAALSQIALALSAQPVSLESLPAGLKRDWVAPSGVARVEVWPSGDPTRAETVSRFVDAVRQLAPDVTGDPVVVSEVGATVLKAFLQAAGLAALSIALLLALTLRSLVGVALTLAPVALTLLLTLGTCVLLRQPINLENLIAFPLVLGIGVSFNVYLVTAWRGGASPELQASLSAAILYSALTTAAAFAALLLSAHPGTASLGLVLTVALGWTIVGALVFQPAQLSRLGTRPSP